MLVSCLMVFALRVFFSFARFTLPRSFSAIQSLIVRELTLRNRRAGRSRNWHRKVFDIQDTAHQKREVCYSRIGRSEVGCDQHWASHIGQIHTPASHIDMA